MKGLIAVTTNRWLHYKQMAALQANGSATGIWQCYRQMAVLQADGSTIGR